MNSRTIGHYLFVVVVAGIASCARPYSPPSVAPKTKQTQAPADKSGPTGSDQAGSAAVVISKHSPTEGVAQCCQVDGALIGRSSPKETWRAIQSGERLRAGTQLIALPQAELASANGAVNVHMVADLTRRLVEPIYETSILLQKPADVDFHFTLDRGIVIVELAEGADSASVRVQFQDQNWRLKLLEEGTKVALGIFGRHPPGLRGFSDDPDEPYHSGVPPTIESRLLVIFGKADLDVGNQTLSLQAPPGLARVSWDNVLGQIPEPEFLEELPPAAREPTVEETEQAEKVFALCQPLAEKPVDQVLDEYCKSDDVVKRRAAVICCTAIDDLDRLFAMLSDPSEEVRDQVIVSLRHWIGRAPGRDEELYKYLVEKQGFKVPEAKTFLQGLFGVTPEEERLPELYEALIALLQHRQLAIREIARWHLYRLAPSGSKIEYDATASEEARRRAVEQWHKLIPPGELPPRLRTKG